MHHAAIRLVASADSEITAVGCCSSMKAKSSLPINGFTSPTCSAPNSAVATSRTITFAAGSLRNTGLPLTWVSVAVALKLSAWGHGNVMDPLQHGFTYLLIEGAHRELHQHVIVPMILGACPAWMLPTVTTAGSNG